MGASLLRLHFHDCFVNGCDGSVLLDDFGEQPGEKGAGPNKNSTRGFDVVDELKKAVESRCPGVVSCADILTLAARDSVFLLGGPSWQVQLGRRDSLTANRIMANEDLPSPLSDLETLKDKFAAKGLSIKDLVALSGAHTIGFAKCDFFRHRIYDESNIDPSFAALRRSNCPREKGSGDANLAALDVKSSAYFGGGEYYANLLGQKGLLHSDQELFRGVGGPAEDLVKRFSTNVTEFFQNFVESMIAMGNLDPLTGSRGEIRLNCRVRN